MKYKCIVDRFYSEIYEKYKSIHHIAEKHNREDIYYKFNSQFSESKKYAERNPRFTYLSIELNKLAKLWDDILVTSRKLNKNIEEIVEPAHKFIFIPSTRIARNKPEASLYCKKLPPDNRLISIRITASKNYGLLCILHEMGHFIGWRKRRDRLDKYMIPMMAEGICLQLYEYACRELTGTSVNYNARIGCIYHIEQNYASDIREDSLEIVGALRSVLKDIKNELRERFESLREIYIKESRKLGEIENEEAKGVEAAFFSSVQAILLSAIYDLISDESFVNHIENAVSPDLQEKEKLKECLKNACKKVQTDITLRKPLWYDEFEKRLEEPAADIFMIKMSGVSIKKYIKLITMQLQELFAEKKYSEDQLCATLALPANTVRFISVCIACSANVKSFRSWTDMFVKLLPFHTKALERIHLREQLYEMYKLARELENNPDDLDFFDPTHYVVEYVKNLYDDERYNDVVKHKYINEMRKITRQTFGVWNSPFGDGIALLKLRFLKDAF